MFLYLQGVKSVKSLSQLFTFIPCTTSCVVLRLLDGFTLGITTSNPRSGFQTTTEKPLSASLIRDSDVTWVPLVLLPCRSAHIAALFIWPGCLSSTCQVASISCFIIPGTKLSYVFQFSQMFVTLSSTVI
jgi:hypothetical protein